MRAAVNEALQDSTPAGTTLSDALPNPPTPSAPPPSPLGPVPSPGTPAIPSFCAHKPAGSPYPPPQSPFASRRAPTFGPRLARRFRACTARASSRFTGTAVAALKRTLSVVGHRRAAAPEGRSRHDSPIFPRRPRAASGGPGPSDRASQGRSAGRAVGARGGVGCHGAAVAGRRLEPEASCRGRNAEPAGECF
jgi:hypothetical protein